MIDALFGSKTRVKLLHLFLANPEKSFYVREITRLIGEQINSVRRELSNMLRVGVIVSNNYDNKLYYAANQQYAYFTPLKMIFAAERPSEQVDHNKKNSIPWVNDIARLSGLKIAIVAGALVRGSTSRVDILLVGRLSESRVGVAIKKIEKAEGRELNYAVMSYDDFYYRLSVRDKFVMEIMNSKHSVVVDAESILG